MKKFTTFLVLVLSIHLGWAQFPPIMQKGTGTYYLPAGYATNWDGFEIDVYGNHTPSSSFAGNRNITLNCNALNQVQFLLKWDRPHQTFCDEYEYFIKIYKVSFDYLYTLPQSGGSFNYQTYYLHPDDYDQSNATVVYASPTYLATNHPEVNDYQIVLNVEPENAYYAEIGYKPKHCPAAYAYHYSASINIAGGSQTEASVVPAGDYSSKFKNSYYGSLEVFEYCNYNEVEFDATSSNCENSYQYTIEEFDIVNWAPISGTTYNSGWIIGQAPSIDMSNYPYSLVPGKVYHFSVAVGPVWDSQDLFFSISEPIADIDLNSDDITYHPIIGTNLNYPVHNYCANAVFVSVNSQESDCYETYRIEVQEVNPNDLTPVGSLIYENPTGGGYATGTIPASINLVATNYALTKTYRVNLTTQKNGFTDVANKYFKRINCRSESENVRPQNYDYYGGGKVQAYPNPTTGLTTVQIEGYESDQPIFVEIFNATGQLVYSKETTDRRIELDLSAVENGIYLVKLNLSTGVEVIRIVKE